MNYVETFNVVKDEFDEETAILVVTALTVNLTMNATMEELTSIGAYTARLTEIIRENLWSHSDKIDLVLKIWEALYDYQICQSMQGLGGCVAKTIKEIMFSGKNFY